MSRALIAISQDSMDGNSQATGLLRQVVALRPDYADGWGALGLVYSWAYWTRNVRGDPGLEQRARAAVARSRSLDPLNAYAAMAICVSMPSLGTWARRERILRTILHYHPENDLLLQLFAILLASVGRWREASSLMARAIDRAPTSPSAHYYNILTLWGQNRLEETFRALDRAMALFPGNAGIWFSRFNIFLFSGRVHEAIDLAADRTARPLGIPENDFDTLLVIARATESRRPEDVEAAMALVMRDARIAVGSAETGLQYATSFDRLDDAFAIAEALYFGRGFDPGEVRFNRMEGAYTRRGNRRTNMLFLPSTAPMRADPRFAELVGEIGLTGYWTETGSLPDYRQV